MVSGFGPYVRLKAGLFKTKHKSALLQDNSKHSLIGVDVSNFLGKNYRKRYNFFNIRVNE